MSFQWTPYAGILLATASFLLMVLGVVWPYRRMPGGTPLVLLLLVCALWALFSGFEAAAVTLEQKIFFSKLFYLASIPTTPLMLVFAYAYRRRTDELKPLNLVLMFSPTPLFQVLAWTNEYHHLIWSSFDTSRMASANILIYYHGYGFWLAGVYGVACSGLAIFHLSRSFFKARGPYRSQVGALLLALAMPWVGSCLYIFNLGPIAGVDLVAVSFSVTAAGIAWSVLRLHMFDLVPIARDLMIESMEDGVIVLDNSNRIIDMNPAARRKLGAFGKTLGEPLSVGLAAWPDLVDVLSRIRQGEQDILLDNEVPFYLSLRIVPLRDTPENFIGRLVTLTDVTERRKLQEELEIKSLEMERLSITDWMTQLYNRRYADKAIESEFSRAARYGGPLALGLIDLDFFKMVNDRYGHATGDEVIRAVADQVRACTRTVDIPARVGGEEFLIIFPETGLQEAYLALERLRVRLASTHILNLAEPVTLSGGVTAWFQGDRPQDALKRADRLLYQAKETGRNRIITDGPV